MKIFDNNGCAQNLKKACEDEFEKAFEGVGLSGEKLRKTVGGGFLKDFLLVYVAVFC